MFSKNLSYKNFNVSKPNISSKNKISKALKNFISEKSSILSSMSNNYKDSYNKSFLSKFKNINEIFLIGMGGSVLGAKAIYSFLKPKKKKLIFIDNYLKKNIKSKKKSLNIIISKSGNTLETISNFNVIKKKNDMNIFITENKDSYLMRVASKLKSDVIHHNKFIGGRYSVLSEVGMLPAELMGLRPSKFRRFNSLIKNKSFLNSLVANVSNILELLKQNKTNSIILNYDEDSEDLFKWYQQLVAESLGKNKKGFLPVISSVPKDNHSLMQYFLDGNRNNFFTFFFVKDNKSLKINSKNLLNSHNFLRNKNLNDICYSQYLATEKVFKQRKIPFRSFVLKNKNEETLGELFTFFILETIILGKTMNINPYDQPAVELIKKETKKILA
jgi:glucose-6-phosphate isomerase